MANYVVKHEFTVGDTDADRSYTLKENGSAMNLTGYTAVKLYAWHRSTDAAVAVITGTITTAASGIVTFDHTTIAATAGTYYAQIETTNASAEVRRSPYFALEVRKKVEAL